MPIFFAATRSFWLTLSGILLLVFEAPPEVLHGFATALAAVLPWSAAEIGSALVRLAPAVLWALALQQRSGAARPYTLDPRAVR